MHIWHLTYADHGRNPLFPDEVSCRKAVRVLGRVAAAQLVSQAGMGIADVAWALDVAPRSVRRLHGPRVDTGTAKVVRMRLALENAVKPKQLVPTAYPMRDRSAGLED